jgi:hypothetical protein
MSLVVFLTCLNPPPVSLDASWNPHPPRRPCMRPSFPVVCGLWGVWCVVCGVWCVVCGVICVVCALVWSAVLLSVQKSALLSPWKHHGDARIQAGTHAGGGGFRDASRDARGGGFRDAEADPGTHPGTRKSIQGCIQGCRRRSQGRVEGALRTCKASMIGHQNVTLRESRLGCSESPSWLRFVAGGAWMRRTESRHHDRPVGRLPTKPGGDRGAKMKETGFDPNVSPVSEDQLWDR